MCKDFCLEMAHSSLIKNLLLYLLILSLKNNILSILKRIAKLCPQKKNLLHFTLCSYRQTKRNEKLFLQFGF